MIAFSRLKKNPVPASADQEELRGVETLGGERREIRSRQRRPEAYGFARHEADIRCLPRDGLAPVSPAAYAGDCFV